ncbi:cell wall-binding repeat-containing protein [Kineococcus sp. SYSU DK001]|uniref:cell wall-binding repeat-containing protein n=1 Tax=Kineococcus sp. SYSU DK001 TaxID=3383122 RepID=UPI003D7D9539
MHTKRHLSVLGGLLAALLLTPATAQAVSTPFAYSGTVRADGADRYATAALVSRGSFAPSPGSTVFLASGESFADALAAGPAAAHLDGPLLLTAASGLPEATRAELARLAPASVHVVGGRDRVPEAVVDAVEALLPSATVDRTAGTDRYATAVAVAQRFFPAQQVSFVLARGDAFPDAVTGAALAGWRGEPLLLTAPDRLPEPVTGWLSATERNRATVVGGTESVSEAVAGRLDLFLTDSPAVTRLSGPDRYATSAAVARAAHPQARVVVVATGRTFPDALAAVPAAAVNGAPLLLTPGDCTPPATAAYLEGNSSVRGTVVVGDESAVADGASARTC